MKINIEILIPIIIMLIVFLLLIMAESNRIKRQEDIRQIRTAVEFHK